MKVIQDANAADKEAKAKLKKQVTKVPPPPIWSDDVRVKDTPADSRAQSEEEESAAWDPRNCLNKETSEEEESDAPHESEEELSEGKEEEVSENPGPERTKNNIKVTQGSQIQYATPAIAPTVGEARSNRLDQLFAELGAYKASTEYKDLEAYEDIASVSPYQLSANMEAYLDQSEYVDLNLLDGEKMPGLISVISQIG
jgi:hypothetical protein